MVASIDVVPNTVALLGDLATLTWSTQWASSVAINGSPVGPTGSVAVAAWGSDTYTLVADGKNAQTPSTQLFVASALTYLRLAADWNARTLTVVWGVAGPNLITTIPAAATGQAGSNYQVTVPLTDNATTFERYVPG